MGLPGRLYQAAVGQNHQVPQKGAWLRLFLLTLFAAYFYVFMEWLFFVTKPSFMDRIAAGKKIELLLTTALVISGFCILALLVLYAPSRFPWLSRGSRLFMLAAGAVPALLLSAASLLMLDNFTYTLFKIGIVTASGAARGFYALLFVLMLGLWYRWVLLQLRFQNRSPRPGGALGLQSILGAGLLLVSSAAALAGLDIPGPLSPSGPGGRIARQPHIILLGGDGMDAANMSVYGYARDTTPNLSRLAGNALLVENAFTNSANTSGSVVSILTGKLPTRTRVVYPPDILMDSHAFQHLPGILRAAGYFTVEIGAPYYVDAYNLNLQEGFDQVNQRAAEQDPLFALVGKVPFQNAGYFLRALTGRIVERLFHIFFIKEMPDPYREIMGEAEGVTDRERFDQLTGLLQEADRPLFVHVHMLTTHGPKFFPRQRIFSIRQRQDLEWMADFYDDAILDFDEYVGDLVDELSETGLLEETLLVIYSDHNQQFQTDQRVPLIFFFPGAEFSGRIQNNAQNLDIAPTLLDYLGLSIPGWMEGTSLISAEPGPARRIFSTGVAYSRPNQEKGYWEIDADRVQPPFYQFGFFQTVVCQDRYTIDLKEYAFSVGKVAGHTQPCSEPDLPVPAAVRQEMLDRLRQDGFDVSALETLLQSGVVITGQH